ncbi:MAG TPA: DUF1059 domain-containing protein [Flavobacteriales bacterium]|jgi:hypothetical protein|nr:DUF1059 domain-containing protein [Flavobacteriales bacterium]HAW20320.1 DUF1059 domain-containing protein [Flavobacteriales bacterium]
MKTMTCNQLGGACDLKFQAESFDEIAELSKKHGMEMFQAGDEDHLKAMMKMKEQKSAPGAMAEWLDGKRKEFDALPD